MRSARRVTVHLKPAIHRALRRKAAVTDQSVSELVNEAVRQTLAEDVDDLAAHRCCSGEPNFDFKSLLKDLRRGSKL